MKDLPDKLNKLGVERRFALDIGSVIAGVRPRGLMHIPIDQKQGLQQILDQYGLRLEAERTLYRLNDSKSREGVLLDCSINESAEKWSEIWYSNSKSEVVDQYELFNNPGLFLGYPECCRNSMKCENALAKLFYKYIFTDKICHWELNRLATVFHNNILMPDFFPCSISCESARTYVLPFHRIAEKIHSQFELDEAIRAMKAPITLIDKYIVQWSDWMIDEKFLRVRTSGSKKEFLSKISSCLQTCSLSNAQLVPFKHLFDSVENEFPCILSIEINEQNAIELPLTVA
jgi:hypothetical protein